MVSKRFWLLALFALIPAISSAQILPSGQGWPGVTPPIFGGPSSGVTGSGIVIAPQLLAPDGSASAPSYSFANDPDNGLWLSGGGNQLGVAVAGVDAYRFTSSSAGLSLGSSFGISWSSTAVAGGSSDVSLSRGAAGTLKVGTGSNKFAIQTPSTSPTCSSNCGTSPAVAGSDSAMTITMGSSGVPASGWVVTFNGTWTAAPSCLVVMGKTGMVVGKQPLTVVTTTTTMTVVTNGTAPATSDVYHAHCFGVQ